MKYQKEQRDDLFETIEDQDIACVKMIQDQEARTRSDGFISINTSKELNWGIKIEMVLAENIRKEGKILFGK